MSIININASNKLWNWSVYASNYPSHSSHPFIYLTEWANRGAGGCHENIVKVVQKSDWSIIEQISGKDSINQLIPLAYDSIDNRYYTRIGIYNNNNRQKISNIGIPIDSNTGNEQLIHYSENTKIAYIQNYDTLRRVKFYESGYEPLSTLHTGCYTNSVVFGDDNSEQILFVAGSHMRDGPKMFDCRSSNNKPEAYLLPSFYRSNPFEHKITKLLSKSNLIYGIAGGSLSFIECWDIRNLSKPLFRVEPKDPNNFDTCFWTADLNDRYLFVGQKPGLIQVYDRFTGDHIKTLCHGSNGPVWDVQVSKSGLLYTSGYDGSQGIKVHNANTLQYIGSFEGGFHSNFYLCGDLILANGTQKGGEGVWIFNESDYFQLNSESDLTQFRNSQIM